MIWLQTFLWDEMECWERHKKWATNFGSAKTCTSLYLSFLYFVVFSCIPPNFILETHVRFMVWWYVRNSIMLLWCAGRAFFTPSILHDVGFIEGGLLWGLFRWLSWWYDMRGGWRRWDVVVSFVDWDWMEGDGCGKVREQWLSGVAVAVLYVCNLRVSPLSPPPPSVGI